MHLRLRRYASDGLATDRWRGTRSDRLSYVRDTEGIIVALAAQLS